MCYFPTHAHRYVSVLHFHLFTDLTVAEKLFEQTPNRNKQKNRELSNKVVCVNCRLGCSFTLCLMFCAYNCFIEQFTQKKKRP